MRFHPDQSLGNGEQTDAQPDHRAVILNVEIATDWVRKSESWVTILPVRVSPRMGSDCPACVVICGCPTGQDDSDRFVLSWFGHLTVDAT